MAVLNAGGTSAATSSALISAALSSRSIVTCVELQGSGPGVIASGTFVLLVLAIPSALFVASS